ncbi:MAG: hypothetical protein SVT52_00500 [Planctomycetota bacterium]|nr:hypothetical protein [Planctomycetota bacterium]
MLKPDKLLTEADVQQVNEVASYARARSNVDIIPVVTGSSGKYDRAEDMVGLWAAALGLALLWLLFSRVVGRETVGQTGTNGIGLIPILAIVIIGFLGGTLLATQIGWLRRLFIPTHQLDKASEAHARYVFYDCFSHRHQEQAHLCVIHLSLYERRVAIVADKHLQEKLTDADLESIRRPILEGLSKQNLRDGLCDAVRRAEELLATSSADGNSRPCPTPAMQLRIIQ